MGNPIQIHQVIMNLCTNAAFAMAETGGTIVVSLDKKQLDQPEDALRLGIPMANYALLAVQDTGKGITPDIQHRLFDPFFTTKPVGQGTGLGLAVVHGIVTEAQGAVHVVSQPGSGTIFQVFWPLVEHQRCVTMPVVPVPNTRREVRILFVDDEEEIALLGKRQLQELGYQVEIFTDSRQAWHCLQENPLRFDVVITDQTMPGLTGSELFTRIKALRADLPVILCSGRTAGISDTELHSLGLQSILQKPLLVNELAQTLDAIFKGNEII